MRKFYQWPVDYGSLVKFESVFSLEESVERLRKITKTKSYGFVYDFGVLTSKSESKLTGNVARDYVSIFRARQGVYHSGRPYFFGSFKEKNERVVLEGSFDVGHWVKLGYWIALPILFLVILFFGFAFFEVSNSIGQKTLLALSLPVIYLFGATMRKFSQGYISEDITWISTRISETLQGKK